MNNTTIGILSFLFIVVGSWVLSWTTFCGGTTEAPANFLFMDGAFKTKGVDAFSFQKSGTFLTVPAATNGEFKKIAAHFKSNENRTLSLVGIYYASEKYTGDSNLGKERAETVKAKLVKYGTPAEKIITSGKKMKGELVGKKLYNAVVFEGNEKGGEEKTSEKVDKPFSVLNPFAVKFDSGEANPKMTVELRNYLDLALRYLNENPNKILMVTGYTGNQGKSNFRLSKEKARVLRRLLRDTDNGVKSEKIKFQGKDEVNEKSSNGDKKGTVLNHRIEITIE